MNIYSASSDLGLGYRFDGVFHFDDGVEYTLSEALHVSGSGVRGEDLRALHEAKKVFDGVIMPPFRPGGSYPSLRPRRPEPRRYRRSAEKPVQEPGHRKQPYPEVEQIDLFGQGETKRSQP